MVYDRRKVRVHKAGAPEELVLEVELSARYIAVLKGLVAKRVWLATEEVRVAAKEAGELISSNDIQSILAQMAMRGLVEKKWQWMTPRPNVTGTSLRFAVNKPAGDVPRKCMVYKATVDYIA